MPWISTIFSSGAFILYLVVSFDEAFNEVSKKGQMDLVCRYWDEVSNKVTVRYFNSAILGHASFEDILEYFESAQNPIAKLKKLYKYLWMDQMSIRSF